MALCVAISMQAAMLPAAGASDAAGAVGTERVVVRWEAEAGPAARRAALAHLRDISDGPVVLDALSDRTSLVEVEGAAGDVAAALTSLDAVRVAEPDRVLDIVGGSTSDAPPPVRTAASGDAGLTPPDDPLFDQQWGLHNVGQVIGPPDGLVTATEGIDVAALEAWEITRGGPDVVVAVIDTAIDTEHPDLADAVAEQLTTVGADGSSTMMPPPAAHGTAVAGVIAARADDGEGTVGLAPEVSLLSVAAFTDLGGEGGSTTLGAIIGAIDLAADAGADVINASWETSNPSPALEAAIVDAGVPFVAAAGNGTPVGRALVPEDSTYPAGFGLPNVLAVTAVGPDGEVPVFANFGAELVHLAAPGDAIAAPGLDGTHVWAQGTSFAVPYASAALALAHHHAPYVSANELVDAAIRTTSVQPALEGATLSGGLLDAAALVAGVGQPVCRADALPAAPFDDVARDNAHAAGIDCLADLGIADGRGDGDYAPDATVTREQVASLLAGMLVRLGVASDDVPSAAYLDVPEDGVHATSIDILAELGVVTVGEDARFRPREPVTRGQLATMLVRAHRVATGEVGEPTRRWFEDTSTSPHVEHIDRARDLGILRGVTRVAFEPAAAPRRDQVATFVARTLDALGREGVLAQ